MKSEINVENIVTENVSKLVDILLDIGQQTAQTTFDAYPSGLQSDDSVSVTAEKTNWNEGVISAKGENVVFMEFGTGVMAKHPQRTEFGFVPGSWSINHSNQFIPNEKEWWYYNGQRLEGTPPIMAMYQAHKEMEQNIEKACEEARK